MSLPDARRTLEGTVHTVEPNDWRPTSTRHAALLVGLVLAFAGVLASRVDVVLLALPLLASVAMAIDRRPAAHGEGSLHVHTARASANGHTPAFDYHVSIAAPRDAELIHLRLVTCDARPWDLILAAHGAAAVTGRVRVRHSGRQSIVAAGYRLFACDGAWSTPPTLMQGVDEVIAPPVVPLESLPLPHRLTGLTGTHESVRPGDGGEFRDVHPYAPGDRLRRIDWKATARRSVGTGGLYVRRTGATSDATLVLVIDSVDDVGERVEQWSLLAGDGGRTSMDVTREAAASIAATAIRAGDRVGLLDIAAEDGVVAAGGGRRHLDRLLRRLSVSEPVGTRLTRRRPPVVPAGSMVYVFSTFLDDELAAIARRWRASGHRVVAVDVLPTPSLEGAARDTRIAHRLLMAERRHRMEEAAASGVELLRWTVDGPGPTREVALRALARSGRRR